MCSAKLTTNFWKGENLTEASFGGLPREWSKKVKRNKGVKYNLRPDTIESEEEYNKNVGKNRRN